MKFTRVTGCRGTPYNLFLSLEEHELHISWEKVQGFFGVRIKNVENENIPTLFLMLRGDEGFYFIDGLKLILRLFEFEEPEGEAPHPVSLGKNTRDLIEYKFTFVAHQLCRMLQEVPTACIDRPLKDYLYQNSLFLPSFSNFNDAAAYCRETLERSLPFIDSKSHPLIPDEAHGMEGTYSHQLHRWKPGAIFQDKFALIEVMPGKMDLSATVLDLEHGQLFTMYTMKTKFLSDSRHIQKFLKHGRELLSLESQRNIVAAKSIREIEKEPCVFFEYVPARSFESMLENELPPLKTSLEYALQICAAMHHAYLKKGLLHMGLSPSSVVITRNGVARIIGYGLLRIFDDELTDGKLISLARHNEEGGAALPDLCSVLSCFAPELFSDKKALTPLSDIYSFGTLLYTMLTGTNPFYHEDPDEVILGHLTRDPEPPRAFNADVPDSLSQITMKCLEKDRQSRHHDFNTLYQALQSTYGELFGQPFAVPEKDDMLSDTDWSDKGKILASMGRHREALTAFKQAIAINPRSLSATMEKASSLISLGSNAEASKALDSALAISPEHPELWHKRGNLLAAEGRHEEALDSLEKALDLAPGNSEMQRSRGRVLSLAGRHLEALDYFTMDLEENPLHEETWIAKGETLMAIFQYEEAVKCFRKASEINPGDMEALYHLGSSLSWTGLHHEALEVFQKALTLKAHSLKVRLGMAGCYKGLGDLRRALSIIDHALKIENDNIDLIVAKAQLLEEMVLHSEALRLLTESLHLDAGTTRIKTKIASLNLKMGFYEKAVSLCEEIKKEAGLSGQAKHVSDSALHWIREKSAIVSKISQFNAITLTSPSYELSTFLSIFCSVDDALVYLSLVEETSQDPQVFFTAAQLYFIKGDPGKARHSLRKSMDMGFEVARSKSLLSLIEKSAAEGEKSRGGGILGGLFGKGGREPKGEEWMALMQGLRAFEKGDHKEALRFFSEVLKREPESPGALFYSGKALGALGDNEKAEGCLRLFKEKHPRSPGLYRHLIESAPSHTPRETLEDYHKKMIGFLPSFHLSWMRLVWHYIQHHDEERACLLVTEILRKQMAQWKLPKQSIEYWNLRGFLELYVGRIAEASLCFSESLKLDSSDAAALLGMGKSYEMKSNWTEAANYFGKLSSTGEADITSAYVSAHLAAEGKEYTKALEAMDNALARKPGSSFLVAKKAGILLESGANMEFLNYYRSIQTSDHSGFFSLLRASSFVSSKMYGEAISLLSGALVYDPHNVPLLKGLAVLSIRTGDGKKAAEYLERALASHSLDSGLYLLEGIAGYQEGHYNSALKSFEHSLLVNPHRAQLIYQFIGATCWHLGQQEKAEKYFRQSLEHDRDNAQHWLNLGILYAQSGRGLQALQCIERALRTSDDSFPAHLAKSKILKELGNVSEAEKSISRALYYRPEDLSAGNLRGIILFLMGNYRESLKCFSDLCAREEKNAALCYNCGIAALSVDDHERAQNYFTRSLTLNPRMALPWLGKAALYKITNDYGACTDAMRNAESSDARTYERWRERIEDSRAPQFVLPLEDSFALPFDLPLPESLEFREPLHLLDLLKLDGAF
ncbi:MAG: tetratricopeptide repeat protein [Candidatus Eremiobacteraeota bacterium]|nr:tetratricopeptide repeat protein [Candidatus Eremiobacteraeota bacterium]